MEQIFVLIKHDNEFSPDSYQGTFYSVEGAKKAAPDNLPWVEESGIWKAFDPKTLEEYEVWEDTVRP